MAKIDLSELPPIDITPQLTLEDIAQAAAEYAGLENLSPSDPAYRVLLAGAYREVLIRQTMNEQALGLTLAHAKGANLDHIGMTNFRNIDGSPIERLENEEDDDYRQRLHKSPAGLSVAGPDGAYEFHTLAASDDIIDVNVASPKPVEIHLTILTKALDGVVSDELRQTILDHLEPKRPLTDYVQVKPAQIKTYQVSATIYLKSGPDPLMVKERVRSRLEALTQAQQKLHHRVVESAVHAALTVEGVEEVVLDGWQDIVCSNTQAPVCQSMDLRFEVRDDDD